MTEQVVIVRAARGESFADVARRLGVVNGITIAADATDAQVFDLLFGQAIPAVLVGAGIYNSVADGLAATASGGFFWVPDNGSMVAYRDNAGVAVEAARVSGEAAKLNTDLANAAVTPDSAAAFLREAQAAYRPQLPAAPETALFGHGDSITAGANASTAARRYFNQLAAMRGLPTTNTANSGDVVADQARHVNNRAVVTGQVIILALGTNEYLWYSGTEAQQRAKAWLDWHAHLAMVLSACVPDTDPRRVTAQEMTTLSGVWTNANPDEDTGAAFTSTVNGSKQKTVTGSTVYVEFHAYDNLGGDLQVVIDDVDMGTWSTNTFKLSGVAGAGITSDEGKIFVPFPLLFEGLENREHKVLVKKVDAGGGFVKISKIMGFDGSPFDGPKVLVANSYEATDAGYNNAGDGAVAARRRQKRFNHLYAVNVAIAQRLGAQRCWLWDWAALAPHLSPDGLHPDDQGMDDLSNDADALLDAMDAGYQQILPADVVAEAAIARRGTGPRDRGIVVFENGVARWGDLADAQEAGGGWTTYAPAIVNGNGSVTTSTNTAAYTNNGATMQVTGRIVIDTVSAPNNGFYLRLPDGAIKPGLDGAASVFAANLDPAADGTTVQARTVTAGGLPFIVFTLFDGGQSIDIGPKLKNGTELIWSVTYPLDV